MPRKRSKKGIAASGNIREWRICMDHELMTFNNSFLAIITKLRISMEENINEVFLSPLPFHINSKVIKFFDFFSLKTDFCNFHFRLHKIYSMKVKLKKSYSFLLQ